MMIKQKEKKETIQKQKAFKLDKTKQVKRLEKEIK